jgi:hypothetical protein
MFRRLAATGVVLATVLAPAASAASVVAGRGDGFSGAWSAIDVDGSRMRLTFSGTGPTRAVEFVDFRATICGGDVWAGQGTGTIVESSIEIHGEGGCDGADAEPWLTTYAYDSATNTVLDGTLAWHRGNPLEAFLGVWTATDVDGSAMTLTFGGSGLTRSVQLFDDLATGACEPAAAFKGHGIGTIGSVVGDGRFIRVVLSGTCAGGHEPVEADSKYEYDVVSDTLVGPLEPLDIGGLPTPWTVVWER